MATNEKQTHSRNSRVFRIIIAFLIIAPLVTIGLILAGILAVTPVRREGGMPTPVVVVERIEGSVDLTEAAPPLTTTTSGSDWTSISEGSSSSQIEPEKVVQTPGSFLAPDNGKVVFAAFGMSAVAVLLAGAVFGLITHRWQQRDARAGHKALAVRYAVLAVVLWIAIGGFLLADLVYAVSVYSRVLIVFAGFVLLLAIVMLLGRPVREKAVAIALTLLIVFAIPFANWNSRKTFLRSLYRIQEGMTLDQVEAIMGGYMGGDAGPVAAEGEEVRSYRHTTEGWGNSDLGVVTLASGRVVSVEFLPD